MSEPNLEHIAEQLRPLAVPIESLTPDPHNSRVHDERNLSVIASSLRQFGQQKPVVVNEQNVVLAGNGLLAAAKSLGWTHIAANRAALDPVRQRAFSAADNRASDLSAFDGAVLSAEMESLKAQEFDIASIGFSPEELAGLVGGMNVTDGMADPDSVPAPADEPATRAGDIWVLGKHRLLCGDSTRIEDVRALMGGERAKMAWTDPPYGVNYGGHNNARWSHNHAPIANDALDENGMMGLWFAAASNAATHTDGDMCWAAPAGPLLRSMDVTLETTPWERHQWLVWVKDRLVLGRSNYHYRHEQIWYGWKKGSSSSFVAGRDQDSVFEIARPSRSDDHPTMKPVELVVRCVNNSSMRGDIVYEPFSGSGTTIVAAEQLSRRCYAIELAPQYVDVSVKRWQDFTGKQATLEGDGRTFAEIAAERLGAPA